MMRVDDVSISQGGCMKRTLLSCMVTAAGLALCGLMDAKVESAQAATTLGSCKRISGMTAGNEYAICGKSATTKETDANSDACTAACEKKNGIFAKGWRWTGNWANYNKSDRSKPDTCECAKD